MKLIIENWKKFLAEETEKKEASILQHPDFNHTLQGLSFGIKAFKRHWDPEEVARHKENPYSPRPSFTTAVRYISHSAQVIENLDDSGLKKARLIIRLKMKQGLADIRPGIIEEYKRWLAGEETLSSANPDIKIPNSFQDLARSFFENLKISGEMKPASWAPRPYGKNGILFFLEISYKFPEG